MREQSNTIVRCPDGHHCLNGSQCAPNPYDEGSFYCDCDESVFEARYEGLKCEHKAEVYCVAEGASTHSFCTNGGKCLEYVLPSEAHIACRCPPEYEGGHCQYVKGSKPTNWPYTSSMQKDSNHEHQYTNSGEIAVAMIASIAAITIIAAIVYQKYVVPKRDHRLIYNDNMKGNDLELDCDGSDLKEAVSDFPTTPVRSATNKGANYRNGIV